MNAPQYRWASDLLSEWIKKIDDPEMIAQWIAILAGKVTEIDPKYLPVRSLAAISERKTLIAIIRELREQVRCIEITQQAMEQYTGPFEDGELIQYGDHTYRYVEALKRFESAGVIFLDDEGEPPKLVRR